MPTRPRPTTDQIPEPLRPYRFHGLSLNPPTSGDEAICECPFCGKNKFNVNVETGMFKCWSGSCDAGGNPTTFLREFWDFCKQETTDSDFGRLSEISGFVGIDAAKEFGCALSVTKEQWLVPGFNGEGQLTGLYRFGRIKDDDKWVDRLLICPGTGGSHLLNIQNWDPDREIVDILEGWRDCISWMEVVRTIGDNTRNICSVTGTKHFKRNWCHFFSGKTVNIMYDNDHRKKNKRTGKMEDGAGVQGVRRVASMLMSHKEPPKAINFLDWGDTGHGYVKDLPDGQDVRDHLRM